MDTPKVCPDQGGVLISRGISKLGRVLNLGVSLKRGCTVHVLLQNNLNAPCCMPTSCEGSWSALSSPSSSPPVTRTASFSLPSSSCARGSHAHGEDSCACPRPCGLVLLQTFYIGPGTKVVGSSSKSGYEWELRKLMTSECICFPCTNG